jgi:hypothetical protein
MEKNLFKFSRGTYVFIIFIWLFSIGMIILFHSVTVGWPPNAFFSWAVYLGIFWLVPLLTAILPTWGVIQQQSIKITESEIERLSLSGKVSINWNEITKIESNGYKQIRLYARKRRVWISTLLFYKPVELTVQP